MRFDVTTAEPEPYIGIHERVDDPGPLFERALPALFAFAASHGVSVVGPPLGIYHRVDESGFDMTVAVPTGEAVSDPPAPIQAGSFPEARVAVRDHVGPYEDLGAAWRGFAADLRSAGHEPAEECWERYDEGPESGRDPSTWRTVLVQTLAAPTEV